VRHISLYFYFILLTIQPGKRCAHYCILARNYGLHICHCYRQFQQKEDPNRVIRLVRDTAWAQQHPTVLGPDRSHFYMGPVDAMHMGYLMYGGGTSKFQMRTMLEPGKKEEWVYYRTSIGLCAFLHNSLLFIYVSYILTLFSIRSRYWKSQNNVYYKWKVSSHRMEVMSSVLL